MSDYRPWDREDKLGPPWKSDDPKLQAWELAHGHDVRLKCYPEFGCQLVEERAERIEAAAREVIEAFDQLPSVCESHCAAIRSLRAVLDE